MAYQPVDIGSAPNDGTGDPIRDAFDKCNDNFVELYAALTGLVELKGSTNCSTNPNYPAASAGDAYRVSVAGKIGGASGTDVEVGDLYYALADNAGGDQATVGTSWDVLQGNTTGGSGGVDVEDEGVSETVGATILNFTGAGVTATDAGGGQVDITIPGSSGGIDVEDEGVAEATSATVLNFTGAGVTATDVGGGQVDIDIPGGSGALTLITEVVTTGSQATVSFSSIATTWRDLVVIVRGRGTNASTNVEVRIQFNGDTASNYDYCIQTNNGAASMVYATTSMWLGYLTGSTAPSNTPAGAVIEIQNYKGTTFNKTAISQTAVQLNTTGTNIFSGHAYGQWRSTSAINAVLVLLSAGNFVDDSVVSLYGRT